MTIVWGDEPPAPKPTLAEAIADWCKHCQNTGMVRDPETDHMSFCERCQRYTREAPLSKRP